MRGFNTLTFIMSTILIGVLLIPCFLAAAAENEGTLGTGIVGVALAKAFYVLRFPTHTLLWIFFSDNGWLYLTGLLINCIFYGFIIERIFSIIRVMRK